MFDRNRLKAQMVLHGISTEKLAEELGINVVTLYNKLKDNGRFTREEINTMKIVLQIEDVDEIFFAPEHTETQEKEQA